jgi:4a-hydroxytetrahydrobiopterin dehydratase
MRALKDRNCIPCQGVTPPLQGENLLRNLAELGSGWRIIAEHHLEKDYLFKNFKDALAFVNRVGQIAEAEGHHPDLFLAWGKVKITLYTHKINGLAAKCDAVLK